MTPALTFYTPTFRRPTALAACLASVAAQTAVAQVEHLVIADHVGIGIHGVYAQIPSYVDAVHGAYVHVLADDDVLADPQVVERVLHTIDQHGQPPLVLVDVIKGDSLISATWPPAVGSIDLGNMIVRADVWKAHAGDWGKRYEGDGDFAMALHLAGIPPVRCPQIFLCGGVMRGAPEVAA